MQGNLPHNNLFSTDNLKYIEINKFPLKTNTREQKNFLNYLQNARRLLNSLEHSICKTSQYEERLLRCKASHSHCHRVNEWWSSEGSDDKAKCSNSETSKSPTNAVNVTESWSIMSIVCLQYQYEELSKKYEALLQAYNERCKAVCKRDIALEHLQGHANDIRLQLVHAHEVLLSIGDKFLALKLKGKTQKKHYKETIHSLKQAINDVIKSTEQARLDIDKQLARCMETVRDGSAALLLAEIRKCNILYMENLKLKAYIEQLAPGSFNW